MLEIFTVGGGEYIVNVLNAVAAWAGGGGYKALIRVVMVMGFTYALLTMAWNLDYRVLWKWFFQATAMYLVLMVPTVTVKVTDRVNPGLAPATVANVPLGLGMMASFTSQVGDWLTQRAETVFVMPNALQYSSGGIIYGAKLLESTQSHTLIDPVIATNLQEYMKSCLFYEILLKRRNIKTIMESPNLLADMGPGSVSLSMSMVDNAGTETIVACNVGYGQVVAALNAYYGANKTKIAKQTFPGLGNAAASAKYDTDIAAVGATAFGGGLTSAQQLTMQAMLIDSVLQARSSFGAPGLQSQIDSFAQHRADVQTRKTYETIAGGAMKWVPLLNIVLTVVFYAMFPIVFLLMLLPNGGLSVARGYVTGFFYLASWGPLFVVLNMIFMSRWVSAMTAYQAGGMTMTNFNPVSEINQDAAALAGYMIMSVPFIAAGMAKGAMAIASHSASFLAPSQNAAEQAAAEATTGNYNYGSSNLASRSVNNTTMDQHRTAPTYETGSGYVRANQADGTSISHTADGSLVYNSEGGMSRMPIGAGATDDFIKDQREVLSQGLGVVNSKRHAETQAWSAVRSDGASLYDSVERRVASGTENGSGLSDSYNRVNSQTDTLSRQLQDRFGLDEATSTKIARETVLSGRASIEGDIGFQASRAPAGAKAKPTNVGVQGGKEPGGTGTSGNASSGGRFGASLDGGTSARYVSEQDFRASNGYSNMQSFLNASVASEEFRTGRDTFVRQTSSSTDSAVSGASQKLDASLSEARSASIEAATAEERYTRYSHDFSEAQSNGLKFSANLNQDLAQYMTAELQRPENYLLRSTGFTPNLASPNAEQRQVRDMLVDRFRREKRDEMARDLGVLPVAPDLKLSGPASASPEAVRAWGRQGVAGVMSQAPDVNITRDSSDPGLSGFVQTRIGAEAARIQGGGAAFRGENFGARMDADAIRDEAFARNHASLAGTSPGLGPLMTTLGLPGSVDNQYRAPPSRVGTHNRPMGGPVDTHLPSRGAGFTTYGRQSGGADQVGTEAFVGELRDIGATWATVGGPRVSYGDMSRTGGSHMPGHDAHQGGREVDIRPFRLDGRNAPTTWNSVNYDRDTTRAFIQTVRERNPDATFLFNDPVLIREGLVSSWKDHDDHLHLRLGGAAGGGRRRRGGKPRRK